MTYKCFVNLWQDFASAKCGVSGATSGSFFVGCGASRSTTTGRKVRFGENNISALLCLADALFLLSTQPRSEIVTVLLDGLKPQSEQGHCKLRRSRHAMRPRNISSIRERTTAGRCCTYR